MDLEFSIHPSVAEALLVFVRKKLQLQQAVLVPGPVCELQKASMAVQQNFPTRTQEESCNSTLLAAAQRPNLRDAMPCTAPAALLHCEVPRLCRDQSIAGSSLVLSVMECRLNLLPSHIFPAGVSMCRTIGPNPAEWC